MSKGIILWPTVSTLTEPTTNTSTITSITETATGDTEVNPETAATVGLAAADAVLATVAAAVAQRTTKLKSPS